MIIYRRGTKSVIHDFEDDSLAGCDLTGVDLFQCNLSGLDLSDTVLTGVNLSYATLEGACLDGAELTGVTCRGTRGDGQRIRSMYLMPFPVLTWDDRLQIGCVEKGAEEWFDLTDAQLAGLDNLKHPLTGRPRVVQWLDDNWDILLEWLGYE